MPKIMMNEDILNVIHAVLSYRRFLIDDGLVHGVKHYDWYERTRDYYASLDLPEGMRKSTEDFENVLSYGGGCGREILAELDDMEEEEMAEAGHFWRIMTESELVSDDVRKLLDMCENMTLYSNPAGLDALNEKIAQLRKAVFDFLDAGDGNNAFKAKQELSRLEEAYDKVWNRSISEAQGMKQKWTDYLSQDVYIRLCDCVSKKADLQELVDAKWAFYRQMGKDVQGFTKEDALVDVLELLDCNSCYFDLTRDEYDELCGKSKGVNGIIKDAVLSCEEMSINEGAKADIGFGKEL